MIIKTLRGNGIKKIAFIIFAVTAALFCFAGCVGEATPIFEYSYTSKEIVTPFWENEQGGYTVVYNEVVTPIRYGNSETATGYLAYEPYRIIFVRDYTLQKEYGKGDYAVEGNAITVKADGSMPYIADEWLDNKNIPEEFSDFVVEGGTKYKDFGRRFRRQYYRYRARYQGEFSRRGFSRRRFVYAQSEVNIFGDPR